MNFKERVRTYLGMNEMSLPTFTEPQALSMINQIAPLVNAGKIDQLKGDYKGNLEAALKTIQGSTNVMKYQREIKLAIAALAKVKTYAATKAVHATPNLNV